MALAYFITFTTYGTWLHGTERGLGSVDLRHNARGSDFVEPDANREEFARERMTQPAYTMDPPRRSVVRDAILGLAKKSDGQFSPCTCAATMCTWSSLPIVIRID